jgi:hypothetical protein
MPISAVMLREAIRLLGGSCRVAASLIIRPG